MDKCMSPPPPKNVLNHSRTYSSIFYKTFKTDQGNFYSPKSASIANVFSP